VVAVLKMKNHGFADLRLSENPLLLIMESVEKPGNLGAMLRTADAAGVDAVLVCDPHTDIFNPNAIRASLGAIFTVPVVACSSEEAVAFLRFTPLGSKKIKIMATWLEAARSLYDVDLRQPLAFVLGAEATGITPFWVEQADERIIIPMSGQVDSLNVSASAAVVLFEAVRQRSH
jgi:TrmH family RNA methyltransferase